MFEVLITFLIRGMIVGRYWLEGGNPDGIISCNPGGVCVKYLFIRVHAQRGTQPHLVGSVSTQHE
jgi:hypothetical protein